MKNIKPKYAKICKLVKKVKAINFLGGECSCCKEKDFFKLAFHHTNPKEKESNVAELFDHSWLDIEKEIKKCILLCHNCHVEKHFNERQKTKENRSFVNKKIMLEFKQEKKCFKCGYDKCTEALEFHHFGEKKIVLSNVNKTIKTVYDLEEDLICELNNCDILCKNCHISEHSDVLFFKENKKSILDKVNNYKGIQKKINRDEVFEMYKKGMKQKDIATHFKASKGTISDIIKKII